VKIRYTLTEEQIKIVWDALFGRRAQAYQAGDNERADKLREVMRVFVDYRPGREWGDGEVIE
jgi:hypothetical protein